MGDYRIIYTIADDVLLIVVVALGHRREVYDLSWHAVLLSGQRPQFQYFDSMEPRPDHRRRWANGLP